METFIAIDFSTELEEGHHTIMSAAPPLYPFPQTDDPKHPFRSWFAANEQTKTWLSNVGLQIMLAHGTDKITEYSRHIYQHLNHALPQRNSKYSVLYFEFNRHDSRFNNVKAMICSFLSQIISRFYLDMQHSVTRISEYLDDYKGWTSTDVYQLWDGIRDNPMAEKLAYVIGRIDECDDSAEEFLKGLRFFSGIAESRYKWVITSQNPEVFKDALAGISSINLDDYQEPDADITATKLSISHSHSQLLQGFPQYIDFKGRLKDVFDQCHTDSLLASRIRKWLRNNSYTFDAESFDDVIKSFTPVSPETFFRAVYGAIKPEKRIWATQLVGFMQYSVRALSPWELGSMMDIFFNRQRVVFNEFELESFVADIEETFGDTIIVENNEVQFSHPGFRGVTIGDADPTLWHSTIARICLEFLKYPAVHQLSMVYNDRYNDYNNLSLKNPLFESRYDFLSYAAKYWPDHYKLAKSKAPYDIAISLFNSRAAAIAWSQMRFNLSNRIDRLQQCYMSTIPILAMTGIDDLVQHQIEQEKSSDTFNVDCGWGLVEATKVGSKSIAAMLMSVAELSQEALKEGLISAYGYGDGDLMNTIIDYVSKIDGFEWPTAILCRTVWLGLEETTQKLLACKLPLDPPGQVADMTPLHIAAKIRNERLFKILLDLGADLTWKAKWGCEPIHTAASSGHPGIVKLLLDANVDFRLPNDDRVTPIQMASDWARPQVLGLLLEAGADPNLGEADDQDSSTSTFKPLVQVSEMGYIACVKVLLEKGAKADCPGPYGSALYMAAENDHVEICRMLLEKGANPNENTEVRDSLLIRCVQGNKIEIVKLLLDHGADIEEPNKFSPWRSTALARAAGEGLVEMVQLLIQRGANVNHCAEGSTPPVYGAASSQHLEVVRVLLDAGADPNQPASSSSNTKDWTALHTSYDSDEICKLLLERGANPDLVSSGGTPLYIAANWSRPEIVKLLLDHNPRPDINPIFSLEGDYDNGMTPLGIACKNKNNEIIRLLLDAGVDPNVRLSTGLTPLEYSVDYWGSGDDEALKTLLEYRPLLNLQDDLGNTVLHSSLSYSTRGNTVKLLVNGGAPIDLPNHAKSTPICIALGAGNNEVVMYLLSKNADVNVYGPDFGSVLHKACNSRASLEVIRAIVKAGADVTRSHPDYPNSLLYATCAHDEDSIGLDIIEFLVEELKIGVNTHGGSLGYPISVACTHSSTLSLEYLLKKGASIDVEDSLGRRPIHLAATRTAAHIELLIKDTPDLSCKDMLGRTVLHWAVTSYDIRTVELVLERCKDSINAIDNDGWTPLMWAVRVAGTSYIRTTWEQDSIIQLLLDQGADLTVVGEGWDRKWTALKLANFYGLPETTLELLDPEKGRKKKKTTSKKHTWDENLRNSRVGDKKWNRDCEYCLMV
jgi:ankyrin repeat protein